MVEPLSLQHQTLLENKLKALGLIISEYSFANLYLFRKVHDYQVLTTPDIFIRGKTYDGRTYLMPTSDIRKMPVEELKKLTQDVDFLYPIPEEWLHGLDQSRFASSYNEADNDYIYAVDALRGLRGAHLSSRRNLLHQFEEAYTATSQVLNKETIQDAHYVLTRWQQEMHAADSTADIMAAREAFQYIDTLHLEGRVYYVNTTPAGFLLGEKLTPDCFVLHFAKGDRDYKGIYAYLYSDFSTHLAPEIRLLNWEQDLGDLNLRQSKRAYYPEQLVKKWRVTVS